MSNDGRRRVALDPKVTADNVDSASWDLGWNFKGTQEAGEDHFKEDHYLAREDDTEIRLVHDRALQLRYLIIDGPSAAKIAKQVPEHLETVTVEDAKQRYEAADSSEDRVSALYLAAIASDDRTVPRTFDEAFGDEEENTRRGAIVGLGYIRGDRALQLVEKAAEDDPSEAVRRTAAKMAEIMQRAR